MKKFKNKIRDFFGGVRLYFRKISLNLVYWTYWKLGNRDVYRAYDLLETAEDVRLTYLRTITAYVITEFKSKKVRLVAENNLKAILIKLLEREERQYIGPGRSDMPFLRDKVENIVGSLTFYDESVILHDGIEVQCIIKKADPTITKLFLLIQLLSEDRVYL